MGTDDAAPLAPSVLVAILAHDKAEALPAYLRCLEAQDYPKDRIGIWIRSNDNHDGTESIVRDWEHRARSLGYREVVADYSDIGEGVADHEDHEWTPARFRVLGAIRQQSLAYAIGGRYSYYFVADCDNFLVSGTLAAMVARKRPIIGPLVTDVRSPVHRYANFHHCVGADGYHRECPDYDAVLAHRGPGDVPVAVVHCTYLVDTSRAGPLRYVDGSDRHEYVIFSESCREAGVRQYLENSRAWGHLSLGSPDGVAVADQRVRDLEAQPKGTAPMRSVFRAIHRQDLWGTGSGPGSRPDATERYQALVQELVASETVRSVLDVGAGDWQFSRSMDWSGVDYLGVDVVPELVAENERRYGSTNVRFALLDAAAEELPPADLILVKDVLQHWPNAPIARFLSRLPAKAIVLVTNTTNGVTCNADAVVGGYRFLDIRLPPFDADAEEVLRYDVPGSGEKTVLRLGRRRGSVPADVDGA